MRKGRFADALCDVVSDGAGVDVQSISSWMLRRP